MMHRRCIEVVDNTLRDIMGTVDSRLEHLPFGGKLVMFGGDLQGITHQPLTQLLPFIRAGGRSTVVNACMTKSSVREHVTKKKLTVNMRERMAELQSEAAVVRLDCYACSAVDCLQSQLHVMYNGDMCLPMLAHILWSTDSM